MLPPPRPPVWGRRTSRRPSYAPTFRPSLWCAASLQLAGCHKVYSTFCRAQADLSQLESDVRRVQNSMAQRMRIAQEQYMAQVQREREQQAAIAVGNHMFGDLPWGDDLLWQDDPVPGNGPNDNVARSLLHPPKRRPIFKQCIVWRMVCAAGGKEAGAGVCGAQWPCSRFAAHQKEQGTAALPVT